MRRLRVCGRATVGQGNDVAQAVLQLRRVPSPVGLHAGLRWTRSRDPLPFVLRKAVRTQGIRLRPRPHPDFHWWRVYNGLSRWWPTARFEERGQGRLPTLRIRGLRGRTDDQQGPDLAQTLLLLRRLQQVVGLDKPVRRTEQGHLLPRLLQQELRHQGCRLWNGCRSPDHGLSQVRRRGGRRRTVRQPAIRQRTDSDTVHLFTRNTTQNHRHTKKAHYKIERSLH